MSKFILMICLASLPAISFAAPPIKPITLPKSEKSLNMLSSIKNFGGNYCKQMKKYESIANSVDAKLDDEAKARINKNLRLSSVLCDGEEYVGYSDSMDANEQIIVNLNAIQNAVADPLVQIVGMGGLVQGKKLTEFISVGAVLNAIHKDVHTWKNILGYNAEDVYGDKFPSKSEMFQAIFELEKWGTDLNNWIRSGSN